MSHAQLEVVVAVLFAVVVPHREAAEPRRLPFIEPESCTLGIVCCRYFGMRGETVGGTILERLLIVRRKSLAHICEKREVHLQCSLLIIHSVSRTDEVKRVWNNEKDGQY